VPSKQPAFVLGKQLSSGGTGNFGRWPRKSALQQMLYLSNELKGTHLKRERKKRATLQ